MNVARMRERGHYVRVLQVMDAFLGSWEAAVAAALPARWRDWVHGRSRRGWLQQDLRALGAAPLAGPVPVPELATPAAAWGSLYVMEGSALGGQVITRELAAAGLRPGAGASYFHGFGPATGAMWREFRAVLEAELAPADRIPPACEAARQTFDHLSLLLEHALHERTAAA
jgi:heme oxygenase